MIIKCRSCGQKNRVPASRVDQKAKCGKCGADVEATGAPVSVDADAFVDLVENSPLPVLVDFWAPWCGPCRMVAPEVEKVASQFAGQVVVAKLNTQDHPAVAQREGVRGIPMFALYKDGKRVKTQAGYMPAADLTRVMGLA